VETRSWIQTRLIALLLVGITTIILISGIVLLIYTENIFSRFFSNEKTLLYYLILFGRWVILFAMFYFSVSSIFYYGPSKKNKWKFFSAGSMLATLLSILASVLFAYYVNHFGTYNKLYGSIGTLIMTMVWIYFNSFILLLGFELNASIHSAKYHNGKEVDFSLLEKKDI
jgi:membrane protein